MQIASLIKFYLESEEVDEFEKEYKIISVILNYPIYLIKINNSKKKEYAHEIVAYLAVGIVIISTILALVLSNLTKLHYEKYNKYFKIYSFIISSFQLIFILPILISFSNIDFIRETFKSIIHIILIILTSGLGFVITCFNHISGTREKELFGNRKPLLFFDLFYLQIISFVLSIISYYADYYLFVGYLVIFFFLCKITYDLYHNFVFYNSDFCVFYGTMILFLYERLMDSIIKKYTINKYSAAVHTYYVPSLVVVFFSYPLIKVLYRIHMTNFSLEHEFNQLKTEKEILMYVKSFSSIMSRSEKDVSSRLKKIGVITEHIKKCNHPNCPFIQDEVYVPLSSTINNKSAKPYNDDIYALHLIKEIFVTYYGTYKKNFDYVVSYISFLIFFFGNYELAMVEIDSAEKRIELSIIDRYILYLFNNYANSSIIESSIILSLASKNDSEATWGILAMLDVLKYDKTCNDLKKYVFLCVETKRTFWKLLENEDIIIEEIYELGSKYFEYKEKLLHLWEKITSISDNSFDSEITKFYCDFLAKICDDQLESELILEKKIFKYEQSQDELYNNKFKSDTGIAIIEGNQSIRPGCIRYINDPLIKLLRYDTKSELIGVNIKTIIPGEAGYYHDQIIQNYFEKARSDKLKKTLSFLSVRTKEKFLVPIHLLISIIPNFNQKIEGIGLIRPRVNMTETLICDERGVIKCTSERIGRLLNLMPDLLEKGENFIQTYFPLLLKPEEEGLPKFFQSEYTDSFKKIELKCELLCPKKNKLDPAKYKIKTHNVFEKRLSTEKTDSDMSLISLSRKGTIREDTESVESSRNDSFRRSEILVSDRSPKDGNTSETPRSKLTKFFKSTFSSPQKRTLPVPKTTNKILQQDICTFPKTTPQKIQLNEFFSYFKLQRENLILKNSDLYYKIFQIYKAITSSPLVCFLTEKADITLYHLGFKIYKKQYVYRILNVSTDSIFSLKKNQTDHLSAFTSNEETEGKSLRGEKDEEEQKKEIEQELGSVSSTRDTNLALEKHLRQLKQQPDNSYHTHKIVGGIMILVSIGCAAGIVSSLLIFFNFGTKFVDIASKLFTFHIHMVNLSKYSSFITIEMILKIKPSEISNYMDPLELLTTNAQCVLDEIKDIQLNFNYLFGIDFYKKAFNQEVSFITLGYQYKLSFMNTVYKFIDNSFKRDTLSLSEILINFPTLESNQTILMNKLLEEKFSDSDKKYFYLVTSLIVVTTIGNILMLMILLMSFKKKKKEHFQMLSAFEKIKNNEISIQTSKFDKFESKYERYFSQFEGHKYPTIQFNTHKNTTAIGEKNKNRLLKKEEAQKSKFNILGITEEMQEYNDLIAQEANSKLLIARENLAQKVSIKMLSLTIGILGFMALIFGLFFFYLSILENYEKLAYKLYRARYYLNYEFLKYTTYFLSYSRLININKINQNYFLLNRTHSMFNDYISDIDKNTDLFQSNITTITRGNICSIEELSIPACQDPTLLYTLDKGMRSLVSLYMKSIDEAYSLFDDQYSNFDSMKRIYTSSVVSTPRFIIENINMIQEEIFNQLKAKARKKIKLGEIYLTMITVIFVIAFFVVIVIRLKKFIERVRKEEILTNRIIGEIPIEIIKRNSQLRKKLKGSCLSGDLDYSK